MARIGTTQGTTGLKSSADSIGEHHAIIEYGLECCASQTSDSRCLLPGTWLPAFLVQRRDGPVVLTEFLSDQMQNRVTVPANGAPLDQGNRTSHAR
jgi:hypothetical protein